MFCLFTYLFTYYYVCLFIYENVNPFGAEKIAQERGYKEIVQTKYMYH